MFTAAVLSLLVLGCSAWPYQQTNLLRSGYGQSYLSQPRAYGFNSGFRSGYSGLNAGYSGLNTGFSGSGFGLGYGGLRTGYSGLNSGSYLAAPVSTQVISAPIATTSVVAAPIQTLGYAHNNLNLLNVRQGQQFEQVVPAAIQQISRTVEYRPFANQEQPIQAQVIEVEPSDNPVHLHFKTRSSTLSTSQSHVAAGPTEVQTSAAQDEPQRLITEVQKPVIQEVKEVISPFRQVTQEINPVVESLHTIVTKGDGLRQQQFVAPAIQTQAYQQQLVAPAIQSYQTVAAAPAISTVAYQAAPALQTVALQSAPVVETVAVANPALTSTSYLSPSYLNTKQIGIQSYKPISTGYSSYSSTY